ncbi:MAG TPA: DCC1-like thiol-disulfide oxidoreductase family protein [Edaphobacter sp.]|nr:DCC1-like thiol-disulfide oxidoreductase family protein [Edaphobacter sp.]
MTAEQRAELTDRTVLLYDGHCGLCNGLVQFCAKRDPEGRMRYVPLQSEIGKELVAHYGETPDSLGSAALFLEALTERERFYHHSDAVAWAFGQLKRPWNWVGRLLRWIPRFLREPFYAFVARVRYAVFGRHLSCPVPSPELRARFVGVMDPGCA